MSRLLNPVFGDKENLDFPFSLFPRLVNRNSRNRQCVPALCLRGTCLPRGQINVNVNATAHASAATSKLAPARGSPPTWRQP